MRDRVFLGFALALIYFAFMLIIQPRFPLTQGVESDFAAAYLQQTQQIDDYVKYRLKKSSYAYSNYDVSVWRYHGVYYPALIWSLSGLYAQDKPVKDWHYFRSARLISILSGALLLWLLFFIFQMRIAVVIFLVLGGLGIFFHYSFLCGTDMVSLAFFLWGLYLLTRFSWWKVVLSAVFLGIAIGIRHEYLVVLPVVCIFYLLHKPKYMLLFLSFFFLALLPTLKSWSVYMTAAGKYLGGENYDIFPPQMFESVNMDTVQSFYALQGETLEGLYPDLAAIFKVDPVNFLRVFLSDSARALLSIFKWTVFFLPWIILFYDRKNYIVYLMALLLFHFLMVNLTGVFQERYFLLEIVVLNALGCYYLLSRVKAKAVCLVLAVLIPFFYVSSETLASWQTTQGLSSEPFVRYRNIIASQQKMISVRPQASFVAGCRWQMLNPNLHDLYQYCLNFDVDFVMWSGFEVMLRSEWNEKMLDPRLAKPEFLLVDYIPRGPLLYRVNKTAHDGSSDSP